MIVINRNRRIAIATRRDKHGILLVPFAAGALSLRHVSDKDFASEWEEHHCSIQEVLDRFLEHAKRWGATKEAMRALVRMRDDKANLSGRLF